MKHGSIVLLILLTLLVTGCGKSTQPVPPTETPVAVEDTQGLPLDVKAPQEPTGEATDQKTLTPNQDKQSHGSEADILAGRPKQLYTMDPSKQSYCKPDEDPAFKKTKEDSEFYYYTGDKTIEFFFRQTGLDNSPILETRFNQSCKFRPTKQFLYDIETLKKDFGLVDAWKKSQCASNGIIQTSLEGKVSVKVSGFKISKRYIDQYTKDQMLGTIEMFPYSFLLDYSEAPKILTPLTTNCTSTSK